MRQRRGRVVEIQTLQDFDRRVRRGARRLTGWHLQGVDFRGRGDLLAELDVAGALFLGCSFADGVEDDVRDRGGIVFPQVPGAPVDTYRTTLYSPAELYAGLADGGYHATLDARAYAWSQQPRDRDVTLARALHDHAVDEALADWLQGRSVVGVMGGHAAQRGSWEYREAARLGRALAASPDEELVVATGGGPGAMEAANLGAYLSRSADGRLDRALEALAAQPSFRPDVAAWARVAFEVREQVPDGAESLGVPTWHYGHEPPNPFASVIAKYFANATREAVLLTLCNRGIVFLPGAAGTVQEVFQDACENYYAEPGDLAPMVLVGRRHWTETLPAWPLLERLARDRAMARHVHLVDSVDEAVRVVRVGT